MQLEIISRVPANPRPTPLLFVHGSWHGAWCWDVHFLQYFADQGFAAHAVSLRGHGASEGRDRLRWARIRDYVKDVAQAASGLSAPPILIGHSMGGFVVQKCLEGFSPPAAVLLASVPPQGALVTALRLGLRRPGPFLHGNLTLSMYPMVRTPELAREAFFSPDLDEETLGGYHARLQDESFSAFLDMVLLDLPKPPTRSVPVLVLGADADSIFTRDQVEATARAYKTTADWLEGVAHDAMLDPRWRVAADRILEWLCRPNGPGR